MFEHGNKSTNIIAPTQDKKITIDYDPVDIAFLLQQWDYYSGGRYYDHTITLALEHAGYSIIRYTNYLFNNIDGDYLHYTIPKTKLCDIPQLSVPNCHTIITANHSASTAIDIAASYNKNLILLVYDPPEWLFQNEYMKSHGYDLAEISLSNKIRKKLRLNIENIKSVKIICLNEQSIKPFQSWYDCVPKNNFFYVEPVINTKVIEFLTSIKRPKTNSIVCVNRNDGRKKLGETVGLLRNLHHKYELNIITNSENGIYEQADKLGIPRKRIKVHKCISDFNKFSIISSSKVLVSTSIFEGYGMWALEGLACGIPVVCYDLESLKHLENEHLYKCNSFLDMEDTISSVLKKENDVKFDYTPYSIESAAIKLKSIVGKIDDGLGRYISKKTDTSDIRLRDWNTKPIVYHFNSLYRDDVYGESHINHDTWNKILNYIWCSDCINFRNSKELGIYTFSNYDSKTILELACGRLNIELNVLGQDWNETLGKFYLKRMEEVFKLLQKREHDHYLILDASDLVIAGNPSKLLEYKNVDSKVLFGAEECCHPESDLIEELIAKKCTAETPFKFLNAGSVFGKQELLEKIFKMAINIKPYKSTNEIIPDDDQGRFNQIYIDTDLIELDHTCEYFYCNDMKTVAEARLRFT